MYLFSVNTKYISFRELKIPEFSLMLRTRENSEAFNTLNEIFGIHLNKVNILYIFKRNRLTTLVPTKDKSSDANV